MKRKRNSKEDTTIYYLKKKEDISSYGLYVEMCYKAMLHLKEHKGFEVSDNKLYERNYIISLAYMVGKYDGKEEKMSGLIVGGDNNKSVFSEIYNIESDDKTKIECTRTFLKFSTDYVAPDFVIHKNNRIQDFNGRNQKLIIEAKTKSNLEFADFCRDFFKLNVYLSHLKFRYGIYLIINTPIEKINCFIHNYIVKRLYVSKKCKNRLLFLIQEKENDVPSLHIFNRNPLISIDSQITSNMSG